ncbi:MAG: hypothetical protein K8S25_02110 [Alphaproteobacteria bacterium]|nr:hypothetical protein [Alphaproteobacteria bacterium]
MSDWFSRLLGSVFGRRPLPTSAALMVGSPSQHDAAAEAHEQKLRRAMKAASEPETVVSADEPLLPVRIEPPVAVVVDMVEVDVVEASAVEVREVDAGDTLAQEIETTVSEIEAPELEEFLALEEAPEVTVSVSDAMDAEVHEFAESDPDVVALVDGAPVEIVNEEVSTAASDDAPVFVIADDIEPEPAVEAVDDRVPEIELAPSELAPDAVVVAAEPEAIAPIDEPTPAKKSRAKKGGEKKAPEKKATKKKAAPRKRKAAVSEPTDDGERDDTLSGDEDIVADAIESPAASNPGMPGASPL